MRKHSLFLDYLGASNEKIYSKFGIYTKKLIGKKIMLYWTRFSLIKKKKKTIFHIKKKNQKTMEINFPLFMSLAY